MLRYLELRLENIVYDFLLADADKRIEEWCARAKHSTSDGQWSRTELEKHARDEHSTFSWLLEVMIIRSGFWIVEVERIPEIFDSKYVLRAQ